MKYSPQDYAKLLYESNDPQAIIETLKRHWVSAWLEKVLALYKEYIRTQEGIARMRITSAYTLSDALRRQIESLVVRYMPNRKIEFSYEIHKEVLGGFRAESDEMIIHASLYDQLRRLFS